MKVHVVVDRNRKKPLVLFGRLKLGVALHAAGITLATRIQEEDSDSLIILRTSDLSPSGTERRPA